LDYLGKGRDKTNRPAPESNAKTTRAVSAIPNRYSQDGYLIEQPADYIPEWVGIKLHRTVVIKFYHDGRIQLNSDGWQTVTTRERMNAYAPTPRWNQELSQYDAGLNIRVYTEKRIMYLLVSTTHESMWNNPNAKRYLYEDNMVIYPDGMVRNQDGELINPYDKSREKVKRKELNQVKKYVTAFISKFIKQEIGNPGNGDCWYCLSHISNSGIPPVNTLHSDGRLTPGFDESNHIRSHLEESYFVPALLHNAIGSQESGLAMIDKHNIAWCTKAPGWESQRTFSLDLTERRLKLLLTRYICKQLGYQVT
jgi:hypothetical protein